MIPSLLLALIIIASAAVTPCMAQDQTGISTNQTEALALRLYGWYKRSKERQAQLQTDITKLKNSINELQPSGPVTTAVAVGVTAEERQHLAELISDLQTEKERCKKMEDAWSKIRTTPPEAHRSFFWRYGPLSECQTASVDPKMDKVLYNLKHFRFFEPSAKSSSKQPAAGSASTTTNMPTGNAATTAAKTGSNKTSGSSIDGLWPHVYRKHTGCCNYEAETSMSITTLPGNVTKLSCTDVLGSTEAKLTGNTLDFTFAGGNGKFTFSSDGKSLTGRTSSNDGHHAVWNASR